MVLGPRWTAENRQNRCPHDGRIFKQGRREFQSFWCYLCGMKFGNYGERKLAERTGTEVPPEDTRLPPNITRDERYSEGAR